MFADWVGSDEISLLDLVVGFAADFSVFDFIFILFELLVVFVFSFIFFPPLLLELLPDLKFLLDLVLSSSVSELLNSFPIIDKH